MKTYILFFTNRICEDSQGEEAFSIWKQLRDCAKITVTPCLPFCPFPVLRKRLHNLAMQPFTRLGNEQKIGAILLHLFPYNP